MYGEPANLMAGFTYSCNDRRQQGLRALLSSLCAAPRGIPKAGDTILVHPMTRLIILLLTMITLSSAQADMLHYAQRFTHHSALLGETRHTASPCPRNMNASQGSVPRALSARRGEEPAGGCRRHHPALRAGLNPAIPSSSSRSTTPTGCGITPRATPMTLPMGAPAGPGYAVTGRAPDLRYLGEELRPSSRRGF